ncbi:TRAP transporter large permease [Bowmanella sp. Y26]|uniref:TRAP transporter large permease n=1 Tax=Bowmanella yangjiangensis TaxID=2811230 RepID=UPI001BDBE461|nr:TRAP transporter large permease [Bowmanella yangjiangensis]MBT1063362.1 TRAP transporter large permease [Bowmanella yangjiangensis]
MELTSLVLAGLFFLLLLMNVPIAVAIGVATLITMIFSMDFIPAVTTLAQRMVGGLDSFALLAIPFFVLSGLIMGQGGIARRLIDCALALVGALPGGLAMVNVLSSTLFGSISGSAVAATSAIGSFMVPQMEQKGYDRAFASAVTVTGATTGMLVPPSNILILYAIASGGVSVSALFLAGYIPGLLLAAGLMLVAGFYASRRGYQRGQRLPLAQTIQAIWAAIPSLMLVVIVIGGIIAGIFTATEAGAIAVAYSLLLAMGVYREVKFQQLGDLLLKAVEITAIVLFLIAVSSAMSWLLSYEQIPQTITTALLALSDNPWVLLLLINLLLLAVGTFMDMTPAVLIFTPIFLPVAQSLGISDLHFGIMMVMNLSIGLCTPPVGSVLFVGASVAKCRIESMLQPMLPLYAVMLVVLALVTLFPALSESLPALFIS